LSGAYNSSTGLLTITGTGTAAEYQAFLRTVSYSNSSGSPTYGTREIQFVLGTILPNFDNNHYYKMVAVTSGLTWSDAKVRAENHSYLGHERHLATITSSTENDFIGDLSRTGSVFIGGSDAAEADTWRWVTGPEGLEASGAGRQFWSGQSNGTAVVPDNYAYWNTGESCLIVGFVRGN
jgi:hypothetical protein